MNRKLPISIQGFVNLREDAYLYVDKTAYIYRLVQTGKQYFLSRPRRFGKSLFLSTVRNFWEGRKDLFCGLQIANLLQDDPNAWQAYPIFYFDFNGQNYQEQGALERVLDDHLKDWESIYGTQYQSRDLGERFNKLLELACSQTGRRCVVLVDEYDKPLLEVMGNAALGKHNKEVFKSFFSVLKKADEYLRFVLITGVTKFEKISIFSDLNQLNDISMNEDFAGICGITQLELAQNFEPEIAALAAKQQIETDQCLRLLQEHYDGYHFHPQGDAVFNPFSLLKAFYEKAFGAYWFETGEPTFLIRKLQQIGFDVRKFTDHTLYASEALLSDYRADHPDPIPLLYQTGYLTIIEYDERRKRYTLGFPNEEVQYGLLETMALAMSHLPSVAYGSGYDIFTLDDHIENGDLHYLRASWKVRTM